MNRKEYKLLVENWRNLLGGVISESEMSNDDEANGVDLQEGAMLSDKLANFEFATQQNLKSQAMQNVCKSCRSLKHVAK